MPKMHHDRDEDERYGRGMSVGRMPMRREEEDQLPQSERLAKFRQLERLAQFQAQSVEFFQGLVQLARAISADADNASSMLRDEYSARSISKIHDFSATISKIGKTGEAEMLAYLRQTRDQIDQYR